MKIENIQINLKNKKNENFRFIQYNKIKIVLKNS
jgi:hypothetical protein